MNKISVFMREETSSLVRFTEDTKPASPDTNSRCLWTWTSQPQNCENKCLLFKMSSLCNLSQQTEQTKT